MEKNIMLAFVSTVSPISLKKPVEYPNIQGKPYAAIQTNESAIVYVERMLKEDSLTQIFLIASSLAKNGKIPVLEPEKPPPVVKPEDLSLAEFLRRWIPKKFPLAGRFFKPEEPPPVVEELPPPIVEELPPPFTHIEFLKNRIAAEFPQLEGRFFEIDYSEGSDSLNENILQIAEIADTVTNYAKNFPDCKIKVHADMTGGFRHASMLMLSIIQLLQYRGVEVGKILYSDPGKKIVYEANEIQRVSLLITGTDEFVKFGSVNALQEYFAENSSDAAAKNLLNAMKDFSDAIKICRTSTIQDDLKNLGEQIEKFRATGAKDLQSELFAKIIDTVEFEYGELIRGGANRFDIIRWCMRKGFWQQAMTLCTEWLPKEIINRGIFKPGSPAVQALAEADSDWKDWENHFVISYTKTKKPEPVDDAPSKAEIDTFCKNLCSILEMSKLGNVDSLINQDYCGELKDFLSEFKSGYNAFMDCRNGKLKIVKFKIKFPRLGKVLQTIYEERKKNPKFIKNFIDFMKSFEYQKIIDMLSDLPNEAFMTALDVDKAKIPRKTVVALIEDDSNNPERKWLNRQRIYQEMLNNEVAATKLKDQQVVLDLLHEFYEIRRKRNEINHAVGLAEIDELKAMVEKYLGELEKI